MVFTRQQELHIVDYAIHAAKMYYGLPTTELRRMVYLYAVAVGSTAIPSGWETDKTASRDWCYCFMRRHPNLALKVPEAISIARIGAFNKVNVKAFFDAYTLAMEKYQFTPDRIYNVDETALSTVMKPMKVVCAKGQPVASQVSRERGETMTFVGIINAVGVALPPVLIIPRVRWNPAFMRNTTYGTKGILQQSGWMTGETFVETLKHIQENSSCSPQNKILLLMDNAECHRNLSIVEYALRNGIVIATLPPHTTDKLQPLDVSVFGPFKAILRSRLNDYQLMHPNEHLTVHQLPEFAADAWTRGATPSNILSGFRSTGIWPIDRNIFPDEAFLGAQVTERPAPPENFDVEVGPSSSDEALSSNEEVGQRHTDSHASPATPDGPGPSSAPGHVSPPPVVLGEPGSSTDPATPPTAPSTTPPTSASTTFLPISRTSFYQATPGPSTHLPVLVTPGLCSPPTPHGTPSPSHSPSTSTSSTSAITPESIRPFPKATPRPYKKGRKTVRACILTENESAIADLRMKAEKRKKKEEKEEEKKKAGAKKTTSGKGASAKRVVRQPEPEPDDSSDEEGVDERLLVNDSSEYSDEETTWTEATYPFASNEAQVR